MNDGEYSPDNYKFSEISAGAIIKNPEMLKFVPDHLKAKKMCKHTVKKLPLGIRYVPDQYKGPYIKYIRGWGRGGDGGEVVDSFCGGHEIF